MFRLVEFELVHWDFWQRVVVPLDAPIVTIVGPNGSGKTTLLDALRTLFALDCSKKRDYKRYVRRSDEEFAFLRGVIDNRRSPSGRHPFFPLLTDDVTIACRIERRGGDWVRQYCIEEGRQSLEALTAGATTWIGVQEFRRRLLDAGLSAAIGQVLSLEQGQTDKLCELDAHALLDLVFQVFGDKQVLDHYREARQHQEATARELAAVGVEIERLALSLERVSAQVDRLREWQALRKERETLVSETAPRLDYVQLSDSVRMARVQLTGTRRDWRSWKGELATVRSSMPATEQALRDAQDERVRTRRHEDAVTADLAAANADAGRLAQVLRERARLAGLARDAGVVDIDAVTAQLGQAEAARASADAQWHAARRERAELDEELRLLRSGQRADPADVGALRARLDEAGIDHDLLPEVVEIVDTTWQAAVEAVLAPFRHIVLLRRDGDRDRAFQIGERQRYRHFIVPDRADAPPPTPGSLLEVVAFTRAVPAWVCALLDRMQRVEDATAGSRLPAGQDWITREGYLRERRGGRYAGVAPNQYRFGRARIAALEAGVLDARTREQAAEQAREHLTKEIDGYRARMMRVDATRELAARADEFARADAQLADAEARKRSAGERLGRARQARDDADGRAHKSEQARDKARERIESLERRVRELDQSPARSEQLARIARLREMRRVLPASWREAAANHALAEQWTSAANVRAEIQRIERRLAEESWVTDESVVELRDKLRQDHESQRAEQARREFENNRARALTDAAREKYAGVLRATARRYVRNLKALGELAAIRVEGEAPLPATDDAMLAQAGLEVRFDFDSKGFIGMNDGDASGGQQVMKSLILLIALMMEESRPGGFVFIDEPFAHLDIFNIDRVASFLKATQAQYLITTPVTHNVNVYDPSLLTLVTSKKRPGERWAPRIARLVRAREAALTV
jgi:chromosome segregation ATPase